MKKVLIALAAVAVAMGGFEKAAAQKFEIGARAGISSQNLDMKFDGLTDAKARLGWHLAAVSRIRIVGFGDGILGAGLFFQPEVVYSQNNIKMRGMFRPEGSDTAVAHDAKVRMQTVDIPLLLSAKVSIVRVQAGPVFNLMNNFSSVGGNMKLEPWGRSAVGYAVGASVDLLGLTIDGRYHGEFKQLKSSLRNGGTIVEGVKGSLSSWSLGVGIMF
ncbi:MAG: PorT family protein [Alistipes sp.]|jgi:hypothetical protein|nr:PorT family protein [Alistipes sp.]